MKCQQQKLLPLSLILQKNMNYELSLCVMMSFPLPHFPCRDHPKYSWISSSLLQRWILIHYKTPDWNTSNTLSILKPVLSNSETMNYSEAEGIKPKLLLSLRCCFCLKQGVRQWQLGVLTRLTLSHKRLAGVKEDVTALHDHALNSQVLADVFCVTHFIVHHPGTMRTWHLCHKWKLFCHFDKNVLWQSYKWTCQDIRITSVSVTYLQPLHNAKFF